MNKVLMKYKQMPKPVKASFWFMICGFLQRGISTITTPIFTRILTTEQYGIYNTFYSWLEVLTVIITLKLAAGVYTQGLVKYEQDRAVFSSSLLGLATTSTVCWFFIYLLFHNLINKWLDVSTILMIAMFGMMWSTIACNFWSARERVDYNYKKLVLLTICVTIAKPVTGIVSVLLTPVYKAEARILSMAVVEVVAYTGLYVSLMKRGRRYFHKEYWKNALQFNLPLIPHYLSKNILNHSDRIMIKAIVGASASGIYSLAYSISSMLTIFNTSLTNTLTPWMYKCMKAGEIRKLTKTTYVLFILIAGVNLFLIAIAPEAVAVFAPSSYGEAIWVIPPVTMAVYFQFLYSLFSNFEFYFEKTKWIMFASIVGAVLNVILNAIFIPMYGYIAAAYTTLVCYLVFSMLHYVFMRKVCEKYCDRIQPYSVRMVLSISLAFMILGFALMFLFPYWYARYSVLLIALIVIWIKKNTIQETMEVIFVRKKDQ